MSIMRRNSIGSGKFLGIIATLAFSVPGLAATTGTITLQGSVPQTLNISVAGVSPYSALDLSTTQTDLPVANITEQTNSRTGYTVTVSSANAGTLVNSAAGSTAVAYTAKYGTGSSLNLTTSQTITNQAAPGVYNLTQAFKISYTGTPATHMVEGTYSDTLTFTIAAK